MVRNYRIDLKTPFGGAVAVAGRRKVSVCTLASVERPASTEDILIQARVFVMHGIQTLSAPPNALY